jgi:hypothetical protein
VATAPRKKKNMASQVAANVKVAKKNATAQADIIPDITNDDGVAQPPTVAAVQQVQQPDIVQPVVQQPIVINPLLQKAIIPGRMFTLPSRGVWYKNGELAADVMEGEVLVQPFTTQQEILMKSPDAIFSGEAVRSVIAECCPGISKPGELLTEDVDLLLSALRVVSYGSESEVSYKHDCEDAKEHSYVIDINKFVNDTKRVDISTIAERYTLTLSNDQVVKMIPPRFDATLKIYQAALDKEQTIEKLEKTIHNELLGIISSVDGITDDAMILEWLQILAPKYMIEIKNFQQNLDEWGINFTSKIKCKDCKNLVDITSEISIINFFLT